MKEELEKFTKDFEKVLISMFMTFVIAAINGTIFWAIYPHIHALFPNAVANGIIAEKMGWWDSMLICWMCGLLFKTEYRNETKTNNQNGNN